ncbi:MAG: hypothetical protein ACK41R_08645 [Thermus sp.]
MEWSTGKAFTLKGPKERGEEAFCHWWPSHMTLAAHPHPRDFPWAMSLRAENREGRRVLRGAEGGLGADDKPGVALVRHLHPLLPELGFALFLGEEVGRKGALQALKACLLPLRPGHDFLGPQGHGGNHLRAKG